MSNAIGDNIVCLTVIVGIVIVLVVRALKGHDDF